MNLHAQRGIFADATWPMQLTLSWIMATRLVFNAECLGDAAAAAGSAALGRVNAVVVSEKCRRDVPQSCTGLGGGAVRLRRGQPQALGLASCCQWRPSGVLLWGPFLGRRFLSMRRSACACAWPASLSIRFPSLLRLLPRSLHSPAQSCAEK